MSFAQIQQIQHLDTTVDEVLYNTCNSQKAIVVSSVVQETVDIYSDNAQIQQIQHLKPLVGKNRAVRQNREKYSSLLAHIRVYGDLVLYLLYRSGRGKV